MTYSEWLEHRGNHLRMMAGKRPTCNQCGEKLIPSYHNINLDPTHEERVEMAKTRTSKDYESFGAEDCCDIGRDVDQWLEERFKLNMSWHHQNLFFESKTDYASGPYKWGYNSNNNFCTLRCGIDYADACVEARVWDYVYDRDIK